MGLRLKRSRKDVNDDGEFIAITPEIEAMAKEIRAVFLEARARLAPKARGGMDMNPYIKAALLCSELKAEPREFTMRQVQEMVAMNVWYPSGLASRKVEYASEKKKESKALVGIASYRSQLAVFELRLKLFTPRQTLEDPVSEFSPLFTCMMAMRFGLPDIFERFRRSARLELDAIPVAREIFGKEVDVL